MTDESLAPVINNDAGEDFDVFDDSESVEAEAEVETEEKVDKEESKPEPEKESEEEEAEEETTASERKSVPVAALKDERKKRQDAEKELDRLKKENESLKSNSKTEPVPDNEFDALVKVSARHLRKIHDDYPEMEKIFMDQVSRLKDGKLEIKNLELYEQYRESDDPAEFAYTYGKSHKSNMDKSSPEFEANLRKRIEKELLADLKKRKLINAELPDLTSTAASAKNTDDPEVEGPDAGVWDD